MIALAFAVATSCSNEPKFVDMFNGEDFTGWHQLGGDAEYKLEDGVIVGVSKDDTPNSFLVADEMYGDFILEFESNCHPKINSGVQFRSISDPDIKNGRVHGYQCEIDPSARAWSGGIYDEAGRGWLTTLDMNPEGQAAYKVGEWNHYRVEACGNTIRIWVNGVNTANLNDDAVSEGLIALQVHSIGGSFKNLNLAGAETKWKNVRILTEDVEANLKKGELVPVVNLIPNTLTPQEEAEGWELLFDGETRESLETFWRGDNKDYFPTEGWEIADGALSIAESGGQEWLTHGNIITKKKYSAFEFSVEFMLVEGANSGVKYFCVEETKGSRPSCLGLEFQLLDDAVHKDAKLYTSVPGSRTLASLYDMKATEAPKRFKGIGKWNKADIKVYPDGRVVHILNDSKMLEYQRNSDEFKEMIKNSKYAEAAYNLSEYPFGSAPEGHILLQDHGNLVFFRSIKVRDLSE